MNHHAYAQSAAGRVQYEGLQKAARLHLLQCCAAAAVAAEFSSAPQGCLVLPLLAAAAAESPAAPQCCRALRLPLSLLLSSRLAIAAAAAAAVADHGWRLGCASGLCYR